MKKYKIFVVISLIILLMSIGGSLAWYRWVSDDDASVSLSMCVPEISFVGGSTLNGEGLVPVTDKNNGLKKQIDVYLNKICKDGDSGVMNLYMKLDLLPDELKEETFIYEVVKDGTVLYSGNFRDKQEGQTLTLLTDQIITDSTSTYFIYVYIDGTRDNPLDMAGKTFKFTIYGEGTGAIYRSNVITDKTDASTFLDTGIERSSIESITLTADNIAPEGITPKDISSLGDGSVMLWSLDEDSDGLAEVYMGGENGVIEVNTTGNSMFADLTNVEYLDLTRLDTSNMTDMTSMFDGDSKLKEVDISNFDTSNVTDMTWMFWGCSSLTSLDVSGFDMSNVESIKGMFVDCYNLTTLDVSNWDTSNVTEMQTVFLNCHNLKTLDVSNWDTGNVTTTYQMFMNCYSLTKLDLSGWNVSNVTNMSCMFATSENQVFMNLTSVGDLSNWNVSNVTDMSWMFTNCYFLKTLDVSDWNVSNVTSMYAMFYFCSSLTSLDVSNWDTSSVTDMGGMFDQCKLLNTLDVSRWNVSSVTNFENMFQACMSITELDVSKWNTESATNMRYMFSHCVGLTKLDLSSFDTSKVTNMNSMFTDCNKLVTIYVSNKWNTNNVTDSTYMFSSCTSLVGGLGTTYNVSYIDKTYARVDGGTSIPGYFTAKA